MFTRPGKLIQFPSINWVWVPNLKKSGPAPDSWNLHSWSARLARRPATGQRWETQPFSDFVWRSLMGKNIASFQKFRSFSLEWKWVAIWHEHVDVPTNHIMQRPTCPTCCSGWNMFKTIHQVRSMGMGQNLLVSILMGWTSIYQLFCGSLGTRVMTHSHIILWGYVKIPYMNSAGDLTRKDGDIIWR